MSKRVKELAEQARDFAVSTVRVDCEGSLDEALDTAFEDKFAELLIKETMRIAANQLPQNTYLDIAAAVVKHFK